MARKPPGEPTRGPKYEEAAYEEAAYEEAADEEAAYEEAAYEEVSASTLAGLLGTSAEPLLLDVRGPDEVAEWAIPGAINIPLDELEHRTHELPRELLVLAYCRSGNRSARAAALLAGRGFRVANLSGGIAAWGHVYDTAVVEAGRSGVVQVRRRGKGCLSYLVGAGAEAFVVDPSADTALYQETARRFGWRITRVFDTHLHADHLSGARTLAVETGASLHLNAADPFHFDFAPLTDGERFALPGGAELSVACVHTPGHTEGSTIFVIDHEAVLTGDTLFVDGVGRPDLADRAEAFARSLHRSLHGQVLSLSDEAVVLPAHYGEHVLVRPSHPVAATVGALRAGLAPLSMGEEEFVGWATTHVAARPPNYVEIVMANRRGSRVSVAEALRLETGPNRCSV